MPGKGIATHIAAGSDRHEEREFDGLSVVHAAYMPGLFVPSHYHDVPSLTLVLSGRFDEYVAGRELRVRESELVVKPASELHSDWVHSSTGVVSLHVVIRDPHESGLTEFVSELKAARVIRGPKIQRIAQDLAAEHDDLDAFSSTAIHGLVLQLSAEASREVRATPSPTRPPWLKRVVEQLTARPTIPSLAEVGARVRVHPDHLSRVFRAHFGTSVGRYARRIRVERAAELIATTDRSLADVARECGFYDPSHLSRAFKQTYGVTPSEFALRARRARGHH